MRSFNGEKLVRARADHADDIHAQVTAIFGHTGFGSLFVPTLAGPGIALKTGFVGKPNIYFWPLHQLLELMQKSFTQLLILFIRPGLRCFCGVLPIGNE